MEDRKIKLPVFTILIEAVQSVWKNKIILLQKTGVPILILMGISYTQAHFLNSSGFTYLVLALVSLIFYTYLAVNSHRVALLGQDSVHGYGLRSFSKRERRFTLWLISIYVLVFFMTMIITITAAFTSSILGEYGTYVIYALVALLSSYFTSRLLIMLPATAVDYDPDVYWAWDASSGNGWRLVMVICVVPLITGTLVALIDFNNTNSLYSLIKELLSYIFVIFGIFSLSLSFKYLQENNSNKELNWDTAEDATPVS